MSSPFIIRYSEYVGHCAGIPHTIVARTRKQALKLLPLNVYTFWMYQGKKYFGPWERCREGYQPSQNGRYY